MKFILNPCATLPISLILGLAPSTHAAFVSRILPLTHDSHSPTINATSVDGPTPLPVVIWHGLGDAYTNPGLVALAQNIVTRYPGTFVYMIRLADSEGQDRRTTFFGSANEEVRTVCDQLSQMDEFSDGFDAVGMSQGGQLLRAYVERCNKPRVRNLITMGSQHMGVSGAAPCTGLFDIGCHLLHRLIESGTVYGTYAQHHVIPAQYFRDQTNLGPYMIQNEFLRDINNERWNDTQPPDSGSLPPKKKESQHDNPPPYQPRNQTYKLNFRSLNNFVMFQFSAEKMVIPSTSAFFTVPNLTASGLPHATNPIPIALQDLPIYQEDYIGLKALDEAGKIHYGTCFGEHMQINDDCWNNVMDWLGDGNRATHLDSSQVGLLRPHQGSQIILNH